jgi:hypothetical protein
MKRAAQPISAVLTLALAGAVSAQSPDGWRTFEGTWSASGQLQTLPTGGERPAATLQLSGAVVLTSGEGLSKGFQSEGVAFDDGSALTVGRSVWTDEHGDRIFSALKGEVTAAGRRVVGTITGGTGRYAGLTGEYSFAWQYVIQAESGTIQGRAIDLKGRFRVGEKRP